jgi:hypothetical protein
MRCYPSRGHVTLRASAAAAAQTLRHTHCPPDHFGTCHARSCELLLCKLKRSAAASAAGPAACKIISYCGVAHNKLDWPRPLRNHPH